MLKKVLKSFIPFLLIAALAASMAGCGSNTSEIAAEGTVSPQEAGEEVSAATRETASVYDFSVPYHMVFYWNYSWKTVNKKFEDTVIGQEIKEITNTVIEIQNPTGNENEKLNLMIASDSLPDVIMMDRNEAYKKLIDLDKLVPLDDYFEKYPGYITQVDPATLNYAKVNDRSYSLLNWSTTPNHPTGNGGWFVNGKIYEEMGRPALNTLDDLYEYLTAVREKGYKVNGKDVIPMQFDAGNFQQGIYQLYFSFGGIGTVSSEDMCYVDGGQLKFFMQDPRWEQAMVFANRLFNEGLMNSDYYVETSQQMNDKRDTGRLAVYASPNAVNEARDGMMAWQKQDPEGSYVMIEPPAGGGFDQTKIANATYKTLGWNSICITKSCKDPERVFQTLDWIASPEGQLITFYGPGGYLYDELDEKGYPIIKRNRSDLTKEEADTLNCEEFSTPGMSEWVDLSKVAANEKLPPEERDFVISNQYNITWKHSANVTEFEGLFTDATTPEGVAFTQVQDMVRKQMPKIVMAKSEEDCRNAVRETVEQAYRMKFDLVEAYKTDIWKENLKKLQGN